MFQTMYTKLQPFKFRLTVFGLLCGSSLLSVALFRVRTILSGSEDYTFLVWNLFLAWIPLGMAYAASSFAKKRRYLFITMPLAVIPWLLFFPNSPYILTDLQHLSHRLVFRYHSGPAQRAWHLHWPLPALEFMGCHLPSL